MIIVEFLGNLSQRNYPLFVFGSINLVSAAIFIFLPLFSKINVGGVNAWFKPFKFCASVGIFSWTMAWFTYSIHEPSSIHLFNWAIIILLGFENIYISIQAARGVNSHFNFTTKFSTILFQIMGLAAAIVALWTGYIGIILGGSQTENLPDYYIMSIRLGILLFVIFAFEGAAMGARSSHSVGEKEGGSFIPVLNWSRQYGDLRIAHFIGMHALQVLPIMAWYVFKNSIGTLILSLFYGLLAFYTLRMALKGQAPFIKKKLKEA